MASRKQIEANRRNAQKSTGPRTEEGKAASRFNAMRHGLRAELTIKTEAKLNAIADQGGTPTAMELDLAAFDDDADGQRRRRMISGIRNDLSRIRRELRRWQETQPDPVEVLDEPQDTPEHGFVRPEPGDSPHWRAEVELPLSRPRIARRRRPGKGPRRSPLRSIDLERGSSAPALRRG